MNDHREAEYEATMKLPFRRTIERIRMIHAARADGRLALRVVLSRVGDGSADDVEFVRWVGREFPLFEASVFQRGDWLSQVEHSDRLGAGGWMCQMVRSVDYRHRYRRALLHGWRGQISHRRRQPPARPRGLQRARYRRLREHTARRQDAEPCNRMLLLLSFPIGTGFIFPLLPVCLVSVLEMILDRFLRQRLSVHLNIRIDEVVERLALLARGQLRDRGPW